MTIWLLSNLPIGLLVFGKAATAQDGFGTSQIANILAGNIEVAEVFVYLCVIIAPILWMMIANWRARTHYRLFIFLFLFQITILILTATVYLLYKFDAELNWPFVQNVALIAYILVIGIWIGSVYFRRAVIELLPAPDSSIARGSGLAERLKDREHG